MNSAKIVAAAPHRSDAKWNAAPASCCMFSNALLVSLLPYSGSSPALLHSCRIVSGKCISACLSDMTATAGPRPCPFRRTATRTWTMTTRRRGVPPLRWGGERRRPPRCPTASHHPPSAPPTMMKCSPFCRPTWMSWPGPTSTRWPSRHGEALLSCQQLQDDGIPVFFIEFVPVIVWDFALARTVS